MASFVPGAWCEGVVITHESPESNVFCQLEMLVMICQSSFSISESLVSESVCLPPIYIYIYIYIYYIPTYTHLLYIYIYIYIYYIPTYTHTYMLYI